MWAQLRNLALVLSFVLAPAVCAAAIALNGATVTATITTGNTLILPSWTPDANDFILVNVGQRNEAIAVSVSGNGLTWTEIANVDNAQGQNGISMWGAQGASPTTGSITVTVTGNLTPVTAQAQRFSGVDTTTPIEAIATNAGPPVTDDDDMLQAVTTVTTNAWVVAGGTHRGGVFTVPTGETGININLIAGSSGDITTTSMWYQGPISSPVSTQLGALNDLDSARDWCMIVVSLKPAGTDDFFQLFE